MVVVMPMVQVLDRESDVNHAQQYEDEGLDGTDQETEEEEWNRHQPWSHSNERAKYRVVANHVSRETYTK